MSTAATVGVVILGWAAWVQLVGHRYELLVVGLLATVGVASSALVTRALAGSALDRIQEMTERVRDEHAEIAAEVERVRSLLEVSPDGVLATDAEGRIRYTNPSLRRLIPLRGEEVIGRRPIEVMPVAEVQAAVDTALAGDEVEGVHCECGPYGLLVKAVPSRDAGVVLLVHDVTTFRTAERTRTDFVSNVSHELRTPIATVMGYAETLLDDRDRLDEDIQPLVDAIYRNTRRLSELFEDLLQLSRIEARRGDLPLELRALVPILEEAVLSAADQALRKDQSFSLECARDLQARVNAEALAAVVGNLAGNAVKYTPSGGRVRVAALQDEGGAILIEVEDDGAGIDKVHHDRIFERFYRVDQGRSRRVGGTGLGLAIAKHLALATGCRIEVSSAPGSGSVFTLYLPGEGP